MKTNNPIFDNLIETQATVVNNWMDSTKKIQAAMTSGSINTEAQNIYAEWYEKQKNIFGSIQADATKAFSGNENKPEEFFKNWYSQQMAFAKQMTDFNQNINNSFSSFGKPGADFANGFNALNSPWNTTYNSWINTLNSSYETYSKNFNNPLYKDMFKNMFESNNVYLKAQELFQPLIKAIQAKDFSAETWKNIYNADNYKKITEEMFGNFFAGSNLKDVYENATKQVHGFFANQNNLSKEYFEQIQNMSKQYPQLFSGNFDKLKELYSEVNNVFGKTFEPILKLVNPGKEKENVEASIALMDKVAQFVIKQNELQATLYTTTQKSLETVAKDYSEKYKNVKAGEVPDYNEVYNDWVKVNEQLLSELFATEEFSKVKGEALNLSMDVKKQFEKQFENMFENYPVVFRSEVEELYKTIYDLKKTVKDLQNKLGVASEEASKSKKK